MSKSFSVQTEKFDGDEEAITLAVEIVTVTSYKGWPDAFAKAARVLSAAKNRNCLLIRTKTEHSASGYQVKLYIAHASLSPKPTKKNRAALAVRLARE